MSMDSSSRKRKLDTERASSDEVKHDDGHLLISLFCVFFVVGGGGGGVFFGGGGGLILLIERFSIAVIAVETAVIYSFVLKGMQTRRKGQCNAELTLSPRLSVKLLITTVTAIGCGT